jgi:transposase/IS5 family transposase
MGNRFIVADRETPFLFPPSVQEWLPEDHLARFVADAVEHLDLGPLEAAYRGRGSLAHHPGVLLALLFYGYATGVFSSRKIERATYDSVAFRYLAANTHPDHDTIATFRRRFLAELEPLFVQLLELACELKLLRLGQVSLDGTKIQAQASRHKALSWEYANRLEAQLQAEVAGLLELAEQADTQPLPDGLSLPEELARRQERLAALAEAKRKIEIRAQERLDREKAAFDEKIAKRQAQEKATGKKPGGRPPKPPEAGPKATDQVSLTDEESRIMPLAGGGFEQAYNAQAAVDMDTLLIVEQHVTDHVNDVHEIEPALAKLGALPEALGAVEHVVADTGYFSAANVTACEAANVTPSLASGRQPHHPPVWERISEPLPAADDADAVTRMRHRMHTPEGRRRYARRKATVEPVFGIVKHVLGFRQFLLRGLAAVRGEWTLVCLAYNLKRLHTLCTAGALAQAA